MKIVFMGTPEFSVSVLRKLVENHQVTAVITQPDKPSGRGKKMKFPPVKEEALKHGIEVFQPNKIKNKVFVETLSGLEADIFVVVAYGQLLSKEILYMPKFGSINVHASLLPKYRGAAPIQRAILDGEKITGVTIMEMNEGLDTGDTLLKKEVEIEENDTALTLSDKLSQAGATLILEALSLIESGKIKPEAQDDALSTYASMLTKQLGIVDWNKSAAEINNIVRGLIPWPCAYSDLEGFGKLKILQTEVIEFSSEGTPGEIVCVDKKAGLIVKTGSGHILIKRMQAQGSKAMDVSSYILGHNISQGLKFN